MGMRYFTVHYPVSNTFGTIAVNVRQGEMPERAIERDGDAVEEWILLGEIVAG